VYCNVIICFILILGDLLKVWQLRISLGLTLAHSLCLVSVDKSALSGELMQTAQQRQRPCTIYRTHNSENTSSAVYALTFKCCSRAYIQWHDGSESRLIWQDDSSLEGSIVAWWDRVCVKPSCSEAAWDIEGWWRLHFPKGGEVENSWIHA